MDAPRTMTWFAPGLDGRNALRRERALVSPTAIALPKRGQECDGQAFYLQYTLIICAGAALYWFT
jgi:hypothetical protein